MQLQGCLVQIKLILLQIVNREGSNFVLFLNRTAVLMDQSESVASPLQVQAVAPTARLYLLYIRTD